eukprot:CAMPEP_0170170352 /NCGR_PEP_ID=MMETSP0040_2-20121228/3345_1 /TAXON_ID=641309 /ORGANISM="Lotharella oceanica, Strain CCMP622" /LENGTH=168 /DNA_ID=CAMNT_0010409711 /DNA_START=323 /DNA_END=830 /DNA_ORIENTATION=-
MPLKKIAQQVGDQDLRALLQRMDPLIVNAFKSLHACTQASAASKVNNDDAYMLRQPATHISAEPPRILWFSMYFTPFDDGLGLRRFLWAATELTHAGEDKPCTLRMDWLHRQAHAWLEHCDFGNNVDVSSEEHYHAAASTAAMSASDNWENKKHHKKADTPRQQHPIA